jgi:uncharacterized protein YndB with AHSA1/START domain
MFSRRIDVGRPALNNLNWERKTIMPPPLQSESPLSERELVIIRETHVSPEKLFAGWTNPSRYPEWYCPKPWFVSDVKLDVRPGGGCEMMFNGPNGEKFPQKGVYLEIVPNEKLVFTDAFTAGWEPNPNSMFVASLTFERLANGGTRYTARARHWTKEACEQHRAMGFEQGWSIVFDQLVKLVG